MAQLITGQEVPAIDDPFSSPFEDDDVVVIDLQKQLLQMQLTIDDPSSSPFWIKNKGSEDEVIDLQNQLLQMQLKCHRLYQDRNETNRKVEDLEQLLNGYEGDNPQEALLTKSLQLAEAMCTIESLAEKVRRLESESTETMLREQQQQQLQKQNSSPGLAKQGSFHGLLSQNSFRLSRGQKLSNDVVEDHGETKRLASFHQKIIQTQIEELEEERTSYREKCVSQQSTIKKLLEEQNLQQIKIEMLEAMLVQSEDEEEDHAHVESKNSTKEEPSTPE
jgi:hypothetical protein